MLHELKARGGGKKPAIVANGAALIFVKSMMTDMISIMPAHWAKIIDCGIGPWEGLCGRKMEHDGLLVWVRVPATTKDNPDGEKTYVRYAVGNGFSKPTEINTLSSDVLSAQDDKTLKVKRTVDDVEQILLFPVSDKLEMEADYYDGGEGISVVGVVHQPGVEYSPVTYRFIGPKSGYLSKSDDFAAIESNQSLTILPREVDASNRAIFVLDGTNVMDFYTVRPASGEKPPTLIKDFSLVPDEYETGKVIHVLLGSINNANSSPTAEIHPVFAKKDRSHLWSEYGSPFANWSPDQPSLLTLYTPVINNNGCSALSSLIVHGGKDGLVQSQGKIDVQGFGLVASHDRSLIIPIKTVMKADSDHYSSAVNELITFDGLGHTSSFLQGFPFLIDKYAFQGDKWFYDLYYSLSLNSIAMNGVGFVMSARPKSKLPGVTTLYDGTIIAQPIVMVYSRDGKLLLSIPPVNEQNPNLTVEVSDAVYSMNGGLISFTIYESAVWQTWSTTEYVIDAFTGAVVLKSNVRTLKYPYTEPIADGEPRTYKSPTEHPLNEVGMASYGLVAAAYDMKNPDKPKIVAMMYVKDRAPYRFMLPGDVEKVVESAGRLVMRESDKKITVYTLDPSPKKIVSFEGKNGVLMGFVTDRTITAKIDGVWSVWDVRNGVASKFAERDDPDIIGIEIFPGLTFGSEVAYLGFERIVNNVTKDTFIPYMRVFLDKEPYGALEEALETEVPPSPDNTSLTFNECGWFGTFKPQL
jgi:hypothetical protein